MFFSWDGLLGFIHALLEPFPYFFIFLHLDFHLRDPVTCEQITGT